MMQACRTVPSPLMALRRCLHSSMRTTAEDRGGRERCLNKVTLLGRVGNIEMRGKESSHPVLQMSLATNDYYLPNDSTEYVQSTEWHRVTIFKPNLRDNVYIYASAGSRLLVEGKLRYSTYMDKDKQIERREAFVQADNVIFLASKGQSDE